jgi:hypothetical protein
VTVGGESFAAAWKDLLAALSAGRGGDSVVLPAGRHPDRRQS